MNNLLGRMLIVLIRESVSIPYADFKESWINHGLNEAFLPRSRTPQDAFRRATPKKVWKNDRALMEYKGGQHLEKTTSNEVMMVYSKGANDKVDINHINRAVIYLQDGEVKDNPLAPLFDVEISMIDEIKKNYIIARDNIDGTQARTCLQQVLASVSALNYRDGVYLIPQEYFSVADSLTGFIQFMESYTGKGQNILWDIPYIDSEQTRSQIHTAIKLHIEYVSQQCLTESKSLQKTYSRNIIKSRRTTLITKLDDVRLILDTYERMLGPLVLERDLLSIAQAELAKVI